ncbi:MAG: membrane protein insertion efficiency factor YidD [Candidatus Melainabacteria bacterium]|nr:membrane protein insertion efficiency factor YidD [Candidatus Melainabacteria bacterium]
MAKQLFTNFYLTFCFVLSFLVKLWQKTRLFRSFFIYSQCRFYPSCSDYFLESLKRFGLLSTLVLFLKRIIRCNPLCAGGIDEVPISIREY